MNYVLLCDIKGSRQIPTAKLWTVLNNLCKRVNQKFDLAVPMVITLGDEWQMVCKSRTQCLEVLEYTQEKLGKMEFRAVIGRYSHPTSHIGSVKKFREYMNDKCSNPLISEDFRKAHNQLNAKIDGIVILS